MVQPVGPVDRKILSKGTFFPVRPPACSVACPDAQLNDSVVTLRYITGIDI